MKKQSKLKKHELDLKINLTVQVKRVEKVCEYMVFIRGKSPILPKGEMFFNVQRIPDTAIHSTDRPDAVIKSIVQNGVKSVFNELIKTSKELTTDEKVELT